MKLCPVLLRHVTAERPHDADAVESVLATGLAQAHAEWPGVTLGVERYLRWVAERIPAGTTTLEHALAGLRLSDLYLACACAGGDPKALAAFDAAFIAGSNPGSDDIKQALRQKLFVAEPGGPVARIARYGGRGELGRWVRTVAARMTIDEARREHEIPTEDALLDAIGIGPGDDPELGQLKKDAKAMLQLAFREAVEVLSARERTLMLQYYIDGVGLVALGKLFDLAPSNVSRTLAKARVVLISEIRRSLMRHKNIGREELDSLVDLVRSQLSLTSGLRG